MQTTKARSEAAVLVVVVFLLGGFSAGWGPTSGASASGGCGADRRPTPRSLPI